MVTFLEWAADQIDILHVWLLNENCELNGVQFSEQMDQQLTQLVMNVISVNHLLESNANWLLAY